MLAVAAGGHTSECVKILLGSKADYNVRDSQGNSILHIAAIYQNYHSLEYLLKNCPKLSIFERNTKGDTPLSIIQERKDDESLNVLKMLEDYTRRYGDQTKEKSEELLNELLLEEQKEEIKRAKKKDKKKRQKIRALADKEGVSYEEMEERLAKEKEDRKREEEQRKKEEEERERLEAEQEKMAIAERQRQS